MTAMSFSGSPDGLSRLKTIFPRDPAGCAGKVREAVKGTQLSVIHSPWAWAVTVVITAPLLSCSSIGKDASKYHGPRARPVSVRGLVIWALFAGPVTSMRSAGLVGAAIFSDGVSTTGATTCWFQKNQTPPTITAMIRNHEIICFIKIRLKNTPSL